MLAENLQAVQRNIEAALQNRTEDKLTGAKVTLVGVTKNHPAEVVAEALAQGIKNIGENRVQEAKAKRELLGSGGCWHLIGHLQTNKARQAVALFDLIESVDSEHLLQTIDKEAQRIGKVQDILLQLNIAHEEQKSGFGRDEYLDILPHLDNYKFIRVRGLMVIAPKTDDVTVIRNIFAAGYRCFCRLKAQRPDIDCLSMGMSGDYALAVEEGANIVRVGTALFGQRDYNIKF